MIVNYIFVLSLFYKICSCQVFTQPEQIHLSIGNDTNTFVVTWVTLSWCNESIVMYGNTGLNLKNTGSVTTFTDGGSLKRNIYIHRVLLPELHPLSLYKYRVGSKYGWSDVKYFKTFPPGSNWPVRYAVIGDMGNLNSRSLAAIQLDTENGLYDMLLHVGDFAYDMDSNNAMTGDQFMRQIEPVASIIPYMTVPGNHENAYNFSNYKNRFSMPGSDGTGTFYSFNVGYAHIVGFNSEFYYYTGYGLKQIENQYRWLKNDLEEANRPENRKLRPWIIAMGHRPMYCSNSDDGQHCENVVNTIRVGMEITVQSRLGSMFVFGLEKLFYDYGVDLIFGAHEHSYERMWPVYNLKVCNGTEAPYTDPPAPVHIITGSAGNQEGEDPFYVNSPDFSAFHCSDYGYTRMNIVNSTHMFLEQVSDDLKNKKLSEHDAIFNLLFVGFFDSGQECEWETINGGKVVDSITYIRSQHGRIFNCKP